MSASGPGHGDRHGDTGSLGPPTAAAAVRYCHGHGPAGRDPTGRAAQSGLLAGLRGSRSLRMADATSVVVL